MSSERLNWLEVVTNLYDSITGPRDKVLFCVVDNDGSDRSMMSVDRVQEGVLPDIKYAFNSQGTLASSDVLCG